MIDMPASIEDSARDAGFNISSGTFGRPYEIQKADKWAPVIPYSNLPNCQEQEIVFIDLHTSMMTAPVGEKCVSNGELDWWVRQSSGYVDPRPRSMFVEQASFDRIYDHGGLFVVFASHRHNQDYKLGRVRNHHVVMEEDIVADSWGFLSVLEHISTSTMDGDEIVQHRDFPPFTEFLKKHREDATYLATLKAGFALRHRDAQSKYISLLDNKYGTSVGGLLIDSKTKALVLILPRLENMKAAVLELLTETLPAMRPKMFPGHEGEAWIHGPKYELAPVLALREKQRQLEADYDKDKKRIENEIGAAGAEKAYLHRILTEDSDELVDAVKESLEALGFPNVIDVDSEVTGNPQEDLQIDEHGSDLLLLEVKGTRGMPKEEHVSQLTKFINRRMRELSRTDVKGLLIVNQQRGLPGLARDYANAFTPEQQQDAEHADISLWTTWDLFLFLRGMVDWQWTSEDLKPLLYRSGRVGRCPDCYEEIGEVDDFFPNHSVVSIKLSQQVSNSDTLCYILENCYHEELASGLQLDRKEVETAVSGQSVGLVTSLDRKALRNGVAVYRRRP